MFLRKAMRYYRLWIYTCNAVLFAAVVVLVAVAVRTASHPYFPLLPGPPAYDPTYLYAYLALFLQAGVIQALGCFGALRLSQKLLHLYWLLLVALLLGDMIVGVVWFLRFPRLPSEINGSMNSTLHKYGYDERSTAAWDSLQISESCCGVRSPENYSTTHWGLHKGVVPSSCCVPRGARAVQSDQAARHVPIHHNNHLQVSDRSASYKNITCARHDHRPHSRGCEMELREWMHKSVETLMILGFCVITFIKLCFVGILKFEIQEMIEKIKVLQGESANTADPELAAALGLVLPGPQGDTDLLGEDPGNNGDDGDGRGRNEESEGKGGAANRVSRGRPESEHPGNGKSSIGIREDRHQNNNTKSPDAMEVVSYPSSATMRPTLFLQSNVAAATDAGGDSDTNSHSALITDTPVRRPRPTGLPPLPPPPEKTRHNGNNNELVGGASSRERDRPLHELYHVRQTQI